VSREDDVKRAITWLHDHQWQVTSAATAALIAEVRAETLEAAAKELDRLHARYGSNLSLREGANVVRALKDHRQ